MNPINFLTASVCLLFFGSLQAAQHWKLESPKDPTFAIKGGVVQSAKGVEGGSLALDGDESSRLLSISMMRGVTKVVKKLNSRTAVAGG